MLWLPAMKAGSTAMTQRVKEKAPSGSMLPPTDPRRPDRVNPPTNIRWYLFLTALAWSTCIGFPLDRQWTRILCWDFQGVQEEIPSEEAITPQIGSVTFPTGQCNSPQLQSCHRLFDQDGHQNSSSSSLESRPCSLWLLLIPLAQKLLLWDNWGDERGCDKVIDIVIQVDFHGAFQKLLERYKFIAAEGDYFEGV